MLIKDIVNKIDKNHKVNFLDFYSFCEKQFGLYLTNYDDSDRLEAYWIGSWYCTDTYVGYKVYLFDDKPVAISFQPARKSCECIEWLSEEDYKNVLKYAKSFCEEENADFVLANLNEDLGDTYKIHYCDALFDYHMKLPYYNGEMVEIIEKLKDGKYVHTKVLIRLKSGDTCVVNVEELDFPFNIIKE